MAAPDILSCGLRVPLSSQHKRAILGYLWDFKKLPKNLNDDTGCGESYFLYYKDQCTATSQDNHAILGISKHKHVVDIVGLLQEPRANRQSIKESMREKIPNQKSVDYDNSMLKSVNFVVRLWLMLDVGDYLRGFIPGTQLHWGDESIRNLIDSEFNATHERKSKVKLEKKFNAYNIEKVAGIKIFWTNNLADHLRMMNDDTKVAVFHHAFFLQCHKTWYVLEVNAPSRD